MKHGHLPVEGQVPYEYITFFLYLLWARKLEHKTLSLYILEVLERRGDFHDPCGGDRCDSADIICTGDDESCL